MSSRSMRLMRARIAAEMYLKNERHLKKLKKVRRKLAIESGVKRPKYWVVKRKVHPEYYRYYHITLKDRHGLSDFYPPTTLSQFLNKLVMMLRPPHTIGGYYIFNRTQWYGDKGPLLLYRRYMRMNIDPYGRITFMDISYENAGTRIIELVYPDKERNEQPEWWILIHRFGIKGLRKLYPKCFSPNYSPRDPRPYKSFI